MGNIVLRFEPAEMCLDGEILEENQRGRAESGGIGGFIVERYRAVEREELMRDEAHERGFSVTVWRSPQGALRTFLGDVLEARGAIVVEREMIEGEHGALRGVAPQRGERRICEANSRAGGDFPP